MIAHDLYKLCQTVNENLKPDEIAIKNRCCNFKLLETCCYTYLTESNAAVTITSQKIKYKKVPDSGAEALSPK